MESEILALKFLGFRKSGFSVKKIISKKNFLSYIKTFQYCSDDWASRIIDISYKIIDFHIKYNSPPYRKYFNEDAPCTRLCFYHILYYMYWNNEFDDIEKCFQIILKMGKNNINKNIRLEKREFMALMHCKNSTIRGILDDFENIRTMNNEAIHVKIRALLRGNKDDHIIKLCECMDYERKKYVKIVKKVFKGHNCPKRFQMIKEKLLN